MEKRKVRKYTKEFKAEAVRLVLEEGMKRSQVAKDLGIHNTVICGWVKKWQEDGKDAFPGKGRLKPDEDRYRKLERENRRLRMEREILKKAITFFGEHQQ